MSYTHLTEHDRIRIFHQKQAELSDAEVARRLGRHRATVGRELRRFRKHPSWPHYKLYMPDGAQAMAREGRARPRGFYWTKHRRLLAYVLLGLRRQWSPEQISGRLPLDFASDPSMRVSPMSIYRYIKADRKAGGSLWRHLRQSNKPRRKAYGTGPRRSRIPDRVPIEMRPAEVESRATAGHWEGDTMQGKTGRLATFVERLSRYVLITRLPDGRAASLNAGAIRCFKKLPGCLCKTLTLDNGSEFIEHQTLGRRLGFATYFANPYASWERGTNENTNGLIRQYLPNDFDLGQASYQRVARIAITLNNRPRKCLAYRTPAEVMGRVLRLK